MKESTGCVSLNSTTTMVTPEDNEVAEILLELQNMICGRGFPFKWGYKRRRSAITVTASKLPSSSLPLKAEAYSPATHLSLSPSESGNNPTRIKRNISLKRKREHYLKTVEELTKSNDLLHGEIKNVKGYFDRVKDFNSKLKARKQELSLCQNQKDIIRERLQLKFTNTVQWVNQTIVPPQINDGEGVAKTCGKNTMSLWVAPSSDGSALCMGVTDNYNVGPTGIPDLNIPLEEPEVVDSSEVLDVNVNIANKNLSRAMAAQARQNRLQIYRVKNAIANGKNLYFCI